MTRARFRDRLRHACVVVACLTSVLEPMEGQTPAGSPPVAGSHAVAPAEAPYTGDLDGMAARRTIRILTPYNRTQFFIDRGVPRGITAETGLAFEEQINRTLKTTRSTHISVVFIPTSRGHLQQSLVAGRGDIIAAPLAITAERRKNADFTTPVRTNAREILVTGPGAPPIGSLDDLAGQVVAINPKTIYAESLAALNATLKRHGKPLVMIKPLPETLEDDDVLEMVNAGLVTATITEDWLADVWKAALPDLTIHSNLVLREDAELALAVRRNSPALLAEANAFLAARGAGALFGNVVRQLDMTSATFVKRATSDAEMKKFREMVDLFRERGKAYDVDFLLMMAQGFQESRLDHSARSQAGAIGVMQITPATGKALKVGDIHKLDPNIHGGVKHIRSIVDRYFADPAIDPLNRMLLAFASHHAGPNRIRTLRREAERQGLNPNVWFNNVERVVSERVGRQPVVYVSNIYKYYVAYTLAMDE